MTPGLGSGVPLNLPTPLSAVFSVTDREDGGLVGLPNLRGEGDNLNRAISSLVKKIAKGSGSEEWWINLKGPQ